MSLFIFFFFQAEDGIRDIGVTGVQTCALPIFLFVAAVVEVPHLRLDRFRDDADHGPRSEEHTSELQSRQYLVCRLLLEKKKQRQHRQFARKNKKKIETEKH